MQQTRTRPIIHISRDCDARQATRHSHNLLESPQQICHRDEIHRRMGIICSRLRRKQGLVCVPVGCPLQSVASARKNERLLGNLAEQSGLVSATLASGVRYVGWTMIQNAPAILLDVSFKLCGTDRYAFDAKTLRPIFQNLRWDGRAWLDRNAPAVRGPYGLTFQAIHLDTVSGSSVRGAIWYRSVRVNVPLDDTMFKCPPVGGRSCTTFRT